MQNIIWLYTKFTDLYWWQMILWIVYAIYFFVKAKWFWDSTSQYGLLKGYREVIFGSDRIFKVYHIVLILFDIPPALIGLTFPFLRRVLCFKVYEFKPDKPVEYRYLITQKRDDNVQIVLDRMFYATSTIEAENKAAEQYSLDVKVINAYILK